MDVRLINPFLAALDEVFRSLLSAEVIVGKPFLKGASGGAGPETGLVAFIGLSGEVTGSVLIVLPHVTALKIVRALTQADMNIDDPQLADALGELLNMIAGGAKAKFEGLDCTLSLPRVVSGKELVGVQESRRAILVLPCDSTLGRFHLEISMRTPKKAAVANPAAAQAQSN